MSVGFASVNGGYATTVTLGHFSDNKQWNPVQKGIVWVIMDGKLVMIQMSSTVVRFLL
jgi:hypothetical protein